MNRPKWCSTGTTQLWDDVNTNMEAQGLCACTSTSMRVREFAGVRRWSTCNCESHMDVAFSNFNIIMESETESRTLEHNSLVKICLGW
jgi:hypothetical protein